MHLRMKTIVAADIHGVTAELKSSLAFLGPDTVFLSPWDGDGCPYASEEEAVETFLARRGVEEYALNIAEEAGRSPVLLIGFSVGATSAWLFSASEACHPRSHAVLYYGSRIRDHAVLAPKCPAALIFAEHERSFKPAELAGKIVAGNASISIVSGAAHGFMNPRSANYSRGHAAHQFNELARLKQALRFTC